MLTPDEVDKCTHPIANYCNIKSPVYLSKLCVIALFMKDDQAINNSCQTIVTLNSILPIAQYFSGGVWVITTEKMLRLTVVCQSKNDNVEIMIKPPMTIVKLEKTCTANNDYLTLLPFYQYETHYNFEEPLNNLFKNYNFTYARFWNTFHTSLPNFKLSSLPKELKHIPSISMDNMISKLNHLDQVRVKDDEPFPFWIYILAAIGLLILIGVLYILVFKRHWVAKLKVNRLKADPVPGRKLVCVHDAKGEAVAFRECTSAPLIDEVTAKKTKPFTTKTLVDGLRKCSTSNRLHTIIEEDN